jgi:hypothetical protein
MLWPVTSLVLLLSEYGSRQAPISAEALRPRPPYRMWAYAYNSTAPVDCFEDGNGHQTCGNRSIATAVPTDYLYPPHTYNLNTPAECFNTTQPLATWLAKRGVACMTWSTCWQPALGSISNTSNDSTVIDFFRRLIASPAENGATSIGMDECGDLGPDPYVPGDIPGRRKMALASEGFRQAKAAHPELFVAAWNPGMGAEPDGIFSKLMKVSFTGLAQIVLDLAQCFDRKSLSEACAWPTIRANPVRFVLCRTGPSTWPCLRRTRSTRRPMAHRPPRTCRRGTRGWSTRGRRAG